MRFKFCGGSDAREWVLGEVAVLSRISCVRLKLITRQVINELAGDGALDVDKITKLVPRGPGFAWPDIKAAVESLFDVKVVGVSTMNPPRRSRRVGRFAGKRAQVKKAVVRLAEGNAIQLFPEA